VTASVAFLDAGSRAETSRIEEDESRPADAGDQATPLEVTDHPPRHLTRRTHKVGQLRP
jgi:hypothetical protein